MKWGDETNRAAYGNNGGKIVRVDQFCKMTHHF